MSLSDLASLGSFVSGVAVLFSFVFLALQLRQGNVNQRALIQMGRSTRVIETIYRLTEPHLADVMTRGRNGDTSMSANEVETYLRASYASLLNFEDTFLQAREGTIHPDAWETSVKRLQRICAAPGQRVAWKRWRDGFGSDFAGAVDQIVSQARLSTWEEPSANWASDIAEEKRLAAN
jgi:hypothetical protein